MVGSVVDIQKAIAEKRRIKKIKSSPLTAYTFQLTIFSILTSAFSFVGAFVIRDFFKTSIEGVTKRLELPDSIANLVYVLLVLGIVVPMLMFISWGKAIAEAEEDERLQEIQETKKNVALVEKNEL